jgi:hypothetical protein
MMCTNCNNSVAVVSNTYRDVYCPSILINGRSNRNKKKNVETEDKSNS